MANVTSAEQLLQDIAWLRRLATRLAGAHEFTHPRNHGSGVFGLGAAALGSMSVVRAASTDEATRETLAIVRPGDAVLVKGSRSVGAERVVAALSRTWPAADLSATSVLE